MLILFSGFVPYLLRKYTNPLCGSQVIHRKPSRSFYNCARLNTAIIIIKYINATAGSLFSFSIVIYIILCTTQWHFNINRLLLNYYTDYISIYFVDVKNSSFATIVALWIFKEIFLYGFTYNFYGVRYFVCSCI